MNKTIVTIIITSTTTFLLTIFTLFLMKKGEAEIVMGESYGINAGVIEAYSGDVVPSGYLLCDGRAVSRTTYADLFSIIGTTYGSGDGSTTFNVPNLNGRVIVGVSSSYPLATIGGSVNTTLSSSNLPSHTHAVTATGSVTSSFTGSSVTTSSNGSHTHSFERPVWIGSEYKNGDRFYTPYEWKTSVGVTDATASSGDHSHTVTAKGTVSSTFTGSEVTTSSTGSGTSFTNLQPYIVVNYIIKY